MNTSSGTSPYEVLFQGESHDVVRILESSHAKGVILERQWIESSYPESEFLGQALMSINVIPGLDGINFDGAPFDVLSIRSSDGRKRKVYFEISSFMRR